MKRQANARAARRSRKALKRGTSKRGARRPADDFVAMVVAMRERATGRVWFHVETADGVA